jgi:hypothetical protein
MTAIAKEQRFSILFRIGLFFLVATLGMGALYGGWLGFRAVLFILEFDKVISEDKYFLLHHVDFEVLREAADQMHEKALKAKALEDDQIVSYSSDNKDLPPALRILKPTHIFVEKERVSIEFGGALYYFGIFVDTTEVKETGDRKLADRVWFYSQ